MAVLQKWQTLDIIYLRQFTTETLNRLKFCDTRVLLRNFRLKYQICAELFLLNEPNNNCFLRKINKMEKLKIELKALPNSHLKSLYI